MRIIIIFVLLVSLSFAGWAFAYFDLSELPPPSQYGNLLISKVSNGAMPPVVFSHWRHRLEYTCRVCHVELEFEMKTNSTPINCSTDKTERFCRHCHNGKAAFDQGTNCAACHNGNLSYGSDKYGILSSKLPSARFGNRIDWVKSIKKKLIRPKRSVIERDYKPMDFKKTLNLEAEWPIVPPAVFPHADHTMWLDCENCHPYIFNIKKKTTKHFEMSKILEGQFCGACHLNVAFPVQDCKRCHPAMKGDKGYEN